MSDVYGERAFKLCRNWFAKVHLENLKLFLELFLVDIGKNFFEQIGQYIEAFVSHKKPVINNNYFFANLISIPTSIRKSQMLIYVL